MKGEMAQFVDSFTKVAKTLIGKCQMTTQTERFCDSVNEAIDILNNTESIEVALTFWVKRLVS